jgi:hypothetical protein
MRELAALATMLALASPSRAFAQVCAPLAARVAPAADPATSAEATRLLGGKESLAFHLTRAWYFDAHGQEFDAMREFRAALAAGVAMPQVRVDGYARLPLSVRLYRTGDVAGARAQWQIALGDATAYDGGEPVGAGTCAQSELATAAQLVRRGEVDAARRRWLELLDADTGGHVTAWQESALRALLRSTVPAPSSVPSP